MSTVLETIICQLRDMPASAPFRLPVRRARAGGSASAAPADYYEIVKNPMNLHQLRINISAQVRVERPPATCARAVRYVQQHVFQKYATREQFLRDVMLIRENSFLYNGPAHELTGAFGRSLGVVSELLNTVHTFTQWALCRGLRFAWTRSDGKCARTALQGDALPTSECAKKFDDLVMMSKFSPLGLYIRTYVQVLKSIRFSYDAQRATSLPCGCICACNCAYMLYVCVRTRGMRSPPCAIVSLFV